MRYLTFISVSLAALQANCENILYEKRDFLFPKNLLLGAGDEKFLKHSDSPRFLEEKHIPLQDSLNKDSLRELQFGFPSFGSDGFGVGVGLGPGASTQTTGGLALNAGIISVGFGGDVSSEGGLASTAIGI